MANLTIRNIDDGVVEQLKAQAKRNHRSLEAEVRTRLENSLSPSNRMMELRELADRIAAMTPRDIPQTDSVELIREDRDR